MLKKELRKQYKLLRSEMGLDQRKKFDLDLFNKTISKFDLTGKNISIFLPIERFNEINTWHFLDSISANFYLPVIKGDGLLEHIKFESKDQIEVTSWGIPEPKYGESISVDKIDLVLVPLLAIDFNGYRVGYGKGFYDNFLKNCTENCKFIGLSYFDPIEKIEDIHAKDIPLDFCVTPTTIFSF